MGVHLLTDAKQDITALYSSTSGEAFGPIFEGIFSEDEAHSFLRFCEDDERGPQVRDVRLLIEGNRIMSVFKDWADLFLDPQTGEFRGDEALDRERAAHV